MKKFEDNKSSDGGDDSFGKDKQIYINDNKEKEEKMRLTFMCYVFFFF